MMHRSKIYKVYFHMPEALAKYVAYAWVMDGTIETPKEKIGVSDDLKKIRKLIKQDNASSNPSNKLTCSGRYIEDDPRIVEVWM